MKQPNAPAISSHLPQKQTLLQIGFLSLLVILYMFLPISPLFYNNNDSFWHLQVGKEIIETGAVPHLATGTFAGSDVPYIPHEAAFQWVAAALYGAFGWHGLLILRAVCTLLLAAGVYQLMKVSAKERGGSAQHPLTHLLVFIMVFAVDFLFFSIRPQMVSIVIVLWFFVVMRHFQAKQSWAGVWILGALSVLLSNFHGGAWPIIVVFWGLFLLESQRFTLKRIVATALIFAGGIANAGGLTAISYFLFVHKGDNGQFTSQIAEWAPVPITNPAFALFILIYLWCVFRYGKKKPFQLVFAALVLMLGLSAVRQFPFLVLFLAYFLPVPKAVASFSVRRSAFVAIAAGVLLNTLIAFQTPVPSAEKAYPVQEMDYVKAHANHPKVLADYNSSGYVMFRGADILADGRFDPFVHEATRAGKYDMLPFERSYRMFTGNLEMLQDEIRISRPDYLIYTKSNHPIQKEIRTRLTADYGEPVFDGIYGYVWRLK